MIQLARYYCQ